MFTDAVGRPMLPDTISQGFALGCAHAGVPTDTLTLRRDIDPIAVAVALVVGLAMLVLGNARRRREWRQRLGPCIDEPTDQQLAITLAILVAVVIVVVLWAGIAHT